MARKWKTFFGRFGQQANVTSGLAALAGFGVTGIGFVAGAAVVTGLGGAIAVGVGGWCAYKAIPPSLKSPQEMAGKIIRDLSELASVDPAPKRVGVLGPTRVGKTTLLAHFKMQIAPNVRTETPYASIVPVPGSNPVTYIALIDAAGQQYSQQFKVFDEAEAIIVLLDHNESDQDSGILAGRLSRHAEFIEQMAHHNLSKAKDLGQIHFLLNKRDLWEGGADVAPLEAWFEAQVQHWKTNARSGVTRAKHSNRYSSDLAAVADILRGWAV